MRPSQRREQLASLGVSRAYKVFEPSEKPDHWVLYPPADVYSILLASQSSVGRFDLVVPEVHYLLTN